MWHPVTSHPTRDTPSPRAQVWALEQKARRRLAALRVAQEATRASTQGPLQWAGAAADEFPPGFAEFAQARAKATSIARADSSAA